MSYKDRFLQLINKIINYSCETLHVGERIGCTNYIDFIKKHELDILKEGPCIMKGHDFMNRPFVVFKCQYIYESVDTTVDVFTILFKRYKDCNYIWHCAGNNDGIFLFETPGGITVKQLELIDTLFNGGYVELTQNMIKYFNIITKSHTLPSTLGLPIGIKLCHVKSAS
jgi:hypothetical protein